MIKITKFIHFIFMMTSLNVFALSNVIFSNNTSHNFYISTEILGNTALFEERDYQTTRTFLIEPFVSNVNAFQFHPQKMQIGDTIYVHTKIINPDVTNKPIDLYLVLKKCLFYYTISNVEFVLPSGEFKSISLNGLSSFDLSDLWPNMMLHVTSFNNFQNAYTWPNIVFTVDNILPSVYTTFDNTSANTFRIISYNIQLFPFYADVAVKPNNKKARAQDIPKLIGDNFDYIVLAEVFDAELRSQIKKDITKKYPYYVDPVGIESLQALSSGVIVFSKWPIIQKDQFIYKSCYDYECLAAKGATYTKILKGFGYDAQPIHIFSTHMQAASTISTIDPYNRPRQKQLRELADFIRKQNIPSAEPIIIAGDLNVDTYDNVLEKFDGTNLQTEYEFLLSTLNAIDPPHNGLKYSADYTLNTMLALDSTSRSKIDHILYVYSDSYAPKMATNTVITMRDTLNASMYPVYDTSDHFPIIGEFILN